MDFMKKLTHLISYALFENYKFVTQNYRDLFSRLEKQGYTEDQAKDLWQRMYHVRQALKSQDREKAMQNAKNLEEVEDILMRVDLVTRATKWHKLAPSKFRKQLKDRIEEFADMLVGYDDFEDFRLNFMNKAAAMSNVDVFFSRLKKHINGLAADFNQVVDEINTEDGIQIETITDDQIIAWVYSYPSSNKCGSSSWCISRWENYFQSYVFNELRKQYFVWDFSYPSADIHSMCGITLNEDMSIHAAHWKNDASATNEVKNTDWWQYLRPFTPNQTKHWLRHIKDTGQEITNYKTAALVAAELDEIDTLKGLIKNNAKKIESDLHFVSRLMGIMMTKPGIEIFEEIGKISTTALTTNYGAALVKAKEHNRTDIFKYIRNKIDKSTIKILTKYNKTRPTAEIQKFLDAYNKGM